MSTVRCFFPSALPSPVNSSSSSDNGRRCYLRRAPSLSNFLPKSAYSYSLSRSLLRRNVVCSSVDAFNEEIDVPLFIQPRIRKSVEVHLKVRDYEMDQFGVVNNAVYAGYCLHARHELLRKLGIDLGRIAQSGKALAVTEMSLKYLGPLRSGDHFVVKVWYSHMSGVRLHFNHSIIKLPDNKPILEGKCTLVWLDQNYRPTRIPHEIRALSRE